MSTPIISSSLKTTLRTLSSTFPFSHELELWTSTISSFYTKHAASFFAISLFSTHESHKISRMKLTLQAQNKDLAFPFLNLAKVLGVPSPTVSIDSISSPTLTSSVKSLSGFTKDLKLVGYFSCARYISTLNPTFDLSGVSIEFNEVRFKGDK